MGSPETSKSFGERLQQLRIEAEMTIEQAAIESGMSATNWQQIEEGAPVRFIWLWPIANALDVKVKELL